MERVTYMEQEVIRLENFNLQIYKGEIMGMLFVNDHGLSAFLNLLQTNMPLYDGYVYYGEEMINSWKESKKGHNRISIIGAQSRLVENMSVSDNIFVLRQGFGQEVIRTRLLGKQLAPFLEDIGIDIPVDTRIEKLSVFERVMVELLRAVVMGHRLIVLNEIGTLISYEEMDKLHRILRHYADQGYSFIYISPHFEEVARVCSRSAIFSNGRIQKIVRKEEMERESLKIYPAEYEKMVRNRMEKRTKGISGQRKVLTMNGVGGEYIEDLTFSVYEGECLVIQMDDNRVFHEIRKMLEEDLQPKRGDILMEGKSVRIAGNVRIAVVKELAARTMVFPELSYMENLCISLSQRIPSIWRKRHIRNSIRQEYGPRLGEEVFFMPVEELSEKQKYQMIYTRILLQKPRIVFCIQPFHGADLSNRMFIWKMLEMLLDHGISVVILSLNLSDSLSLADRLLMIGENGTVKEILSKDFAFIPATVPWKHVYRKK